MGPFRAASPSEKNPGFRTATLQVIATATIGAILGGGGLGRFIFDGLSQGDAGTASIYCGAILVAGLAIGVDLLLAWAQRRLTPRALRRTRLRGSSGPASVVGGPDIGGPDVAAPAPSGAA